MKIAAIICEYNPFHNGHKYQIKQIKKNYDAVICIMSGNFVQRGDVAITDKWTRTKAALLNGADLIVELPVCFSLNTAERFAYGGVCLADSLCVVDSLVFGSECGDIDILRNAAEILGNETGNISRKIKDNLKSGMSYPKARYEAFAQDIPKDILCEPNNILAIEYIKALNEIQSNIKPMTIKRYIASHNDSNLTNSVTSASAIRKLMRANENFCEFIPENLSSLYNFPKSDINSLSEILCYLLMTKTAEELSKINDVSEGLENRLKEAAKVCRTFDEISEFVKSKRFTSSRVRRILLSVILNIDKDIAKQRPQYIRVLGMNGTGTQVLSEIKTHSSLPIITKAADFKHYNRSFDLDIISGEIFSLIYPSAKSDYLTSPVISFS